MKREESLPPEFAGLSSKVHYVHKTSREELHSSCPHCGGSPHPSGEWPDRFIIFLTGKPRAWCRRCNYTWFPDMDNPNWKPDLEQMKRWNAEREERMMTEMRKAERALTLLRQEKLWLSYHLQMTDEARKWWIDQGVPKEWQDFWKLGYTDEKLFKVHEEAYTSPAYTIPKFDFGWIPTNIDYRLLNPPLGAGKYRPLPDLPAAYFLSRPDKTQWDDEVFIVEGSKKAMVLGIRKAVVKLQVVGIPSKNSWAGIETRGLGEVGRVWVILDPDALEVWAIQLARKIGDNARLVTLPVKVDDGILCYHLDGRAFQSALRQAIKVKPERK